MATNDTTPSPPPEDDESIGSPPPPKSSSFETSPPPPPPSKAPPPAPPVSDNPTPPPAKETPPPSPPPNNKTPPPLPLSPEPPSNPKDNNPPPEVTHPPPTPPSPSKEEPTSPPSTPSTKSPPTPIPTPSQENNKNPPPTDLNVPPTDQHAPLVDSKPPTTESHAQPPPDKKFPSPSQLVPTPTTNHSLVTFPPPSPHSENSPHAPLTSQNATGSSSSGSSSSNMAVYIGIPVAGLLILALVVVCFVCSKRKNKRPYYYNNGRQTKDWSKRRHSMDHVVGIPPQQGTTGTSGNYSSEYNQSNSGRHAQSVPPHSPMGGLGSSQCQFSYEDLAAATAGFSQANLLGQGGFGYVHKGVLPDGRVVAVKSLKSGSGQGEREFQAEVEIISRVHHRHLVSLVGYCITNGQRMLVYEFVPNQTMEHHLHGKGQPVMDWSFRVRVAIGSAKGLAYLHEDCHPRIIHRDIKAANILLDENYEAMVADFGLAKLTTENVTHVSTRVMGTFGYLAPEYASSGKLSEKSDVFSFGVMLLELITGRRPIDVTGETMEDSLAEWARPLLEQAMEDGDVDELVDPRLEGNFPPQEMNSMISCAAASIRHSAKRRPKMSQIVRALEGDSILVEEISQVPKKRGNIGNGSTTHDSTYDTVAYNADMMKFRNMVMNNNNDFGTSSEFGATSEYGLNPSSSSISNNSKEMGSQNSGQHKIKY